MGFQQSGFKLEGGFVRGAGSVQQAHFDAGRFQRHAGPGSHAESDHGLAIPQQADEAMVIVGMGMKVVRVVIVAHPRGGLVIDANLPVLDLTTRHAENEEGGAPAKMS